MISLIPPWKFNEKFLSKIKKCDFFLNYTKIHALSSIILKTDSKHGICIQKGTKLKYESILF